MADEQNTTSTAPVVEVTQTEPAAEGERTYTQAEVDALKKQAHDSAFAEARRALKPKRTDEQPKQTKTNRDERGASDDAARLLAQRDALDDVLAERQVSQAQRKQLRDLMQKVDPDEPAAWLESFVESFLGSPAAKQDSKQPATKESAVSQRPPHEHPGPPQTVPVWERPSDPFKWTEEDVARLQAIKGPREANRIIRQKAEQYARTMRIQLAPQRR